jgi:hypothetical protein
MKASEIARYWDLAAIHQNIDLVNQARHSLNQNVKDIFDLLVRL